MDGKADWVGSDRFLDDAPTVAVTVAAAPAGSMFRAGRRSCGRASIPRRTLTETAASKSLNSNEREV